VLGWVGWGRVQSSTVFVTTLSFSADDLDAVEGYIEDLMTHLKSELPESAFPRSAWKETPFMWFATAGMRLLLPRKANALTNRIREVSCLRDMAIAC
jgi:Golgi nucleoside diphosphatase